MSFNEAKNFVLEEDNAGYEKVRFEYISKSKVPSFEIKKLQEKYGIIDIEEQLYAVEVSYKKKYNNITKIYFVRSHNARKYYYKVMKNMNKEITKRAYMSDNVSELKRLSKVEDFRTRLAVANNLNTSADTLLYLWKNEYFTKDFVLNNPSADIDFLKSIVAKNEDIECVAIAKENLRRREGVATL